MNVKFGTPYRQDIILNGANGIYDFYADYDWNNVVGTDLTQGKDYYCSVYTNLWNQGYSNPTTDPLPDAQAEVVRSADTFTAGEYPIIGSQDDKMSAPSQAAGSADVTIDVTP